MFSRSGTSASLSRRSSSSATASIWTNATATCRSCAWRSLGAPNSLARLSSMNATARTAHDAGLVLRGERRGSFRILPFLGPAFVACVAYIDPGNFATNIAGGSKYGYTLCWVIVAANVMAMLIQTLSAKLGIATGRNLPEVCRERFSKRTSIGLWVQAELIAMATDLAEFLGAALGIKLLLDLPLFPAALITGVITFLILGLQRYGFRPLEAVITAFVVVIGICYLVELWLAHPPLGTVGHHAVVPEFKGKESVLLAVGILGATVM